MAENEYKIEKPSDGLCGKVVQILESDSLKLIVRISRNNQYAMMVSYEYAALDDGLFELNVAGKKIWFKNCPRSSSTKELCQNLVDYLEERDYRVCGRSFISD